MHDGRWFYYRYRGGHASLALGADRDAVLGRHDVIVQVGDGLQGCFDSEQQRERVFVALLNLLTDPEVVPDGN